MSRLPLLVAILTLASACGWTVSVSAEHDSAEPINLAPEQTLRVELDSNRAVSSDADAYEWIVLESGVVALDSIEHLTRPEPESEWVGGHSTTTIFTFRPTKIGTGELVIGYVPAGEDGSAAADRFVATIVSKRD